MIIWCRFERTHTLIVQLLNGVNLHKIFKSLVMGTVGFIFVPNAFSSGPFSVVRAFVIPIYSFHKCICFVYFSTFCRNMIKKTYTCLSSKKERGKERVLAMKLIYTLSNIQLWLNGVCLISTVWFAKIYISPWRTWRWTWGWWCYIDNFMIFVWLFNGKNFSAHFSIHLTILSFETHARCMFTVICLAHHSYPIPSLTKNSQLKSMLLLLFFFLRVC